MKFIKVQGTIPFNITDWEKDVEEIKKLINLMQIKEYDFFHIEGDIIGFVVIARAKTLKECNSMLKDFKDNTKIVFNKKVDINFQVSGEKLF